MAITETVPTTSFVGRRMTLEEFDKLPLIKPYLELIDGVVRQKVAAKVHHGRLQPILAQLLNEIAEPKGIGLAFTEARFTSENYAPVPDVSFYLWDRIPFLDDGALPADFAVPPDIAVEIISPEQRVSSLTRKCTQYLEKGVRVALLILPEERAVLVFRPGEPVRTLEGDERIDLDDVLPELNLTVAQLFNALTPRRPGARRRRS